VSKLIKAKNDKKRRFLVILKKIKKHGKNKRKTMRLPANRQAATRNSKRMKLNAFNFSLEVKMRNEMAIAK
jgi:hypothetical protein